MDANTLHPIKVAAKRAGLTPHVIRAWEKRYQAVKPDRTDTNRRLYSDADIERLRLLRQATEAGRGIGHVAALTDVELAALIAGDQPQVAAQPVRSASNGHDPDALIHYERCLAEVQNLDARALEVALLQASVSLSSPILIEEVILPLMFRIGDLWQQGVIRAAHEHMASAVVRTFLGNVATAYLPTPSSPAIAVATPAGQVHEFGALAAAATAASEGWRVTYLGTNLPAEDIAAAAVRTEAKAVALSLVYPSDDAHVHQELQRLRRTLPKSVRILVGGRAASSYDTALKAIGADRVSGMAEFRNKLREYVTRIPNGA